jgi:RNA polymerase sigma factor (sigma-70 family)
VTPDEIEAAVRAAAGGDQASYERLVAQFAGLVWSVARAHRLSRSDAEDVAQAVWLRLMEHLGRIREPRKLAGWLSTTTRNECLALLRSGQRTVPSADAAMASGDRATAVDHLLLAERQHALLEAFASMGESCRALLRLLSLHPPIGYREVSDALGIPVGSIGPTRQRCLDQLRRHPAIVRIS